MVPACFYTGAGMFIGTMVVGAVLWVADGAAMRGALLRDVSCYALSVVAVVAVLASGQVGGLEPVPVQHALLGCKGVREGWLRLNEKFRLVPNKIGKIVV